MAGRPKIFWTAKDKRQFEECCKLQCTREEICAIMGFIDSKTLYRLIEENYFDEYDQPMNFSTVYDKYSAVGKMSVRRAQFKLAQKNAAVTIWWGKQYLGQREPSKDVDSEIENSAILFDKAMNGKSDDEQ